MRVDLDPETAAALGVWIAHAHPSDHAVAAAFAAAQRDTWGQAGPPRWRVVGVALATRDVAAAAGRLPLREVTHVALVVDQTVAAADATQAASDALWAATREYTTFRWQAAPTVEEVVREA